MTKVWGWQWCKEKNDVLGVGSGMIHGKEKQYKTQKEAMFGSNVRTWNTQRLGKLKVKFCSMYGFAWCTQWGANWNKAGKTKSRSWRTL
jgi:hypothetical protein